MLTVNHLKKSMGWLIKAVKRVINAIKMRLGGNDKQ